LKEIKKVPEKMMMISSNCKYIMMTTEMSARNLENIL